MQSQSIRSSAVSNHSLLVAGTVTVVSFLATTLAQPRVLVHLPLQNLLKNVLHADRSMNAAFFFWIGLPWYVKPLLGILSDAHPIFGSRRKSYIPIGALAAVAAWSSLIAATHSYSELLVICLLANLATVVTSTALVHEPYQQPARAGLVHDMGLQLRVMMRARTVWAAAALAALFYVAPGLNTSLFYLQQNTLP